MTILNGRYNQSLEERSYITIEFLDNFRRVPFFENLVINESKKANYVKYSPLGRSSPIYSYFGSDSRQLDLTFYMTFNHIADNFSKDLGSLTTPSTQNTFSTLNRSSFFKKNVDPHIANSKSGAASFDAEIAELIQEIKIERSGPVGVLAANVAVTSLFGSQAVGASIPTANRQAELARLKVIDYIVYWVNLIRATVVNNSTDVSKGPPIVRVTHGIMYQDIPCVCLSYKIGMDESAGYDRTTLLPRRIEVSMSLVEVRHGDFGKYQMAHPIKRDNIAGWEVLIDTQGSKTMDPVAIFRGKK